MFLKPSKKARAAMKRYGITYYISHPHSIKCCRCGVEVTIEEYVQCNRELYLFSQKQIFHFCKSCYLISMRYET